MLEPEDLARGKTDAALDLRGILLPKVRISVVILSRIIGIGVKGFYEHERVHVVRSFSMWMDKHSCSH